MKAYLLTWGLMATGALGYLGSLAWQPELLATPPPPTQVSQAPEPDPVLATATKALVEIGTVRRSVGEIQRDVRQLKETVEQHEAQGKTVQSRLAVLEERTTAPEVPVAAAPAPTVNSKAADRAKAKAHLKTAEPRQLARVVTTIETAKPGPIAEAAQPAPIETGSIAQVPIVFGDAVVTTAPSSVVTSTALAPPAPATPSRYAVQLAAGPSLDALRLQWSLLAERHGAALASLTPHVVPPRNAGGPYRLLAGPLPNKVEADKVCAEMGVGNKGCFALQFIGEPL